MANGRVEARITVPTGGWAFTATTSLGGPTAGTIAAGTYYATEFAAAFQASLRAVRTPATWTVNLGSTEAGSGRTSIAQGTAGTWSIAFTNTEIRDVLGFTGNITAVATTQTSTNAMEAMWLPDCPIVLPTDDTVGHYVSDLRQSISPTGAVYSLVGAGNVYREWTDCRWTHVAKDRAIYLAATTYPMPWELFVYNTQMGGKTYFGAGARLAIYSNATTNTLLGYFDPIGLGNSRIAQAVQGWAGRWTVTIPRLISQAS